MAVIAGRTELGLRDTSRAVTIPDHPKARLMYYLDCICSILQFDNSQTVNRLRNYNNYVLSRDETDQLIVLCYLLSPDILLNKCIFHSERMCGDLNNRMFELSVARTHFAVTDTVLIGGQGRRVQKIMTFKLAWLENNYFRPMRTLMAQRRRQRELDCCVIL